MRLEKYLVNSGVMSRRQLKKKILEGDVRVNGKQEFNIGVDIDEERDVITYCNEPLKMKTLKYFVMNKPAGYITAMSNPISDRKVISEILPDEMKRDGIAPVGRLDKDTEGVLLFTNDGDLNYELTYPDKLIDKEYYVELAREITSDDIKKLEEGVTIDDYTCKPAKVKFVTGTSILLTIQEGKYHQVKKMLKSVGNFVVYLKRVRFGKVELGDLPIGTIKEINKSDII